jgi:putative ABC transport system permease protein
MYKNYFVVAIRNIVKHKFFAAVNILGMTMGITASLLIMLYILEELSYDEFHANADRIYQVGLHGKIGGQDIMVSTTCPPMAAALVGDIPEVEASTRLEGNGQMVFKVDDKAFTEDKIFYADSNFFDFFSFSLKAGTSKQALAQPNSIVLTERTEKKLFCNESGFGKLIVIGSDNKTFKVTGIVKNPPTNSHVTFNALISASTSENLKATTWLNNGMYTYFLLRKNASVESVNKKYDQLVEKYVGPEVEKFMGISLKQMKEQGGAYGYYSTKLTDIHLHSVSQGDIEEGGNSMYVYFFGGIGLFIIVIACINFMNLSTARSAGRAKEVGLRKTLGSLRSQMVRQFLIESVMYAFVAILLALVACYFLLPSFNLLAGKELGMQVTLTPPFLVGMVGLVLFVGMVAGSYPAFYLTSFSPVEVLKGKIKAGVKSKGVRSSLVVLQFGLSIFLIIFTLVVYQQIKYMQEKNMGISKNNIISLYNLDRLGNNKETFRNALLQQTGITNVSYTNNYFPGVNNTTVFKAAESEQDHIMGLYYADYDHQKVMKFDLKEGRYFSNDFPSDSSAIILNEAAVKEFGWKDPLNQFVLYAGDGKNQKLKVIGVIRDFNFESFKTNVRPLSIMLTKNSRVLMIRYEGSASTIVNTLEKLWKQQAGNEPIDYSFLDERFDELFRSEQRMGKVFTVFTGLAIFIASLGLFALAAFTSEQRTKEIGIRKAMGASTFGLTVLLSREFTQLVLVAFVPAAGLGWYVSNSWLKSFAYRIDVNPFILVLSGLLALVIAWITVSFQSIKAARSNPVKSLRYE